MVEDASTKEGQGTTMLVDLSARAKLQKKEEDSEVKTAAPKGTAAMLSKYAGAWQGENGEKYVIEEGTGKCKRIDQKGLARTFGLRWHAGRGVVIWGRSYFADPADGGKSCREISWYKLRDAKKKHRQFVWTRRPSSQVASDNSSVLSLTALLQYRRIVGAPLEHVAKSEQSPSNLGVASYEELGIEVDEPVEFVPPPSRKEKHARTKKVEDMGMTWPRLAEGIGEWEGQEARTEAVLAALCADPAAAAAAEMWPPFSWPAECTWGENWWTAFPEQAWVTGHGPNRIPPRNRSMFEIKPAEIEAGKDLRTTVMVRNLAKHCTHDAFAEFLAECGLQDRYCFLYLPSSRGSRPTGIAFVDFHTSKDVLKLLNAIGVGTGAGISGGAKDTTLEASYARLQGLQQLAAHFGHTAVLASTDAEKRPRFITAGESSTEDSETTKGTKAMKADAKEFVPGISLRSVMATAESTPELSAISEPEHHSRQTMSTADMMIGEGIADKVRAQVEYYFSADNLCQDCYLRSLMDAEGWVNLVEIAKFPRLKRTGFDVQSLSWALASSKELELDAEKSRVRSRGESCRQAFGFVPTLPAQTMPASEFAVDALPAEAPRSAQAALAIARTAAAEHAAWIATAQAAFGTAGA